MPRVSFTRKSDKSTEFTNNCNLQGLNTADCVVQMQRYVVRVAIATAVVISGTEAALASDDLPKIDYETARLERRLQAARLAGEIKLDGNLDEPAWIEAPVARNFIQNDPREGAPATFDTEVRLLYDDEALYFGVFAKDDQPGAIIVSDLKKDFNTNNSDGFRIVIDTFKDERNGYQFATNPAGAKWDAQMSNEGRENNSNWDGIWDVRTRVIEIGWVAEMRIPFRTLKFDEADPQAWGVNFERKVRRLNEDSYWSPIPRIYDIQRVSLAGSLAFLLGVSCLRLGRVDGAVRWLRVAAQDVALEHTIRSDPVFAPVLANVLGVASVRESGVAYG